MVSTNTRISVVHINKNTLESYPVSNGNVYFVSDTKELFYDIDSTRFEVKDILILDKESDRTSILFTPLNKFYFILETKILWLYKYGTWYQITSDLTNYYNKQEISNLLVSKADISDIPDTSNFVTSSTLESQLVLKADKSYTYSKSEVDGKIADAVSGGEIDLSGYAKVEDVNVALSKKADIEDLVYDWVGTKTEYEIGQINGTIKNDWLCYITDDEQDFITIENYYTKSEIDNMFGTVESILDQLIGEVNIPETVDNINGETV